MIDHEIKTLISKGHLKAAIEKFHDYTYGSEFEDVVYSLKQRYAQIINSRIDMSLSSNELMRANVGLGRDIIEATNLYLDSKALEEPTKILFIYSNPRNKAQLDFGGEIKRIKNSLKTSTSRPNDYIIVVEEAVEAADLHRIINQHRPRIVHLSMHYSKSKGLLMQDAQGNEKPVSNEDLYEVFKLVASNNCILDCVILNACNSELASKLIVKEIPFVIGMRDFVPDDAALLFSKAFYEMIFDGENYYYAFETARVALKMHGFSQETEIPVHKIPVLFDADDR